MLKSMSQVMKRTWAQLFNYFPLYFLFKYHLVSKQNEISQVLVDIQSWSGLKRALNDSYVKPPQYGI